MGGTVLPFALVLGSMETNEKTALTPIESINSYFDGIYCVKKYFFVDFTYICIYTNKI